MTPEQRTRVERRLSLATGNDGALDPVGEFVPSDVRAALAHIDALVAEVERLKVQIAFSEARRKTAVAASDAAQPSIEAWRQDAQAYLARANDAEQRVAELEARLREVEAKLKKEAKFTNSYIRFLHEAEAEAKSLGQKVVDYVSEVAYERAAKEQAEQIAAKLREEIAALRAYNDAPLTALRAIGNTLRDESRSLGARMLAVSSIVERTLFPDAAALAHIDALVAEAEQRVAELEARLREVEAEVVTLRGQALDERIRREESQVRQQQAEQTAAGWKRIACEMHDALAGGAHGPSPCPLCQETDAALHGQAGTGGE